MKRLCAVLVLLAAGCSSTKQVGFYINAINTEEQEIPGVIIIDDTVFLNPVTNEPIKTPARIDIKFPPKTDGSGYSRVKLSVRGVAVDPQGKITFGLREGETSPYIEEPRFLDAGDSRVQLFILRQNKDHRG